MPLSIVEFEVDWSDCDPAGIVFYPQFFRMMNTGTHKLFANAGLPFHELTAKYGTAGTPLLDVQSTFRSPARFGDHIRLESTVEEWRDKTFVVRHVMKAPNLDKGDGKGGDRVLFEAREIRAWVAADPSAPSGIKAQPIPTEIKALYPEAKLVSSAKSGKGS